MSLSYLPFVLRFLTTFSLAYILVWFLDLHGNGYQCLFQQRHSAGAWDGLPARLQDFRTGKLFERSASLRIQRGVYIRRGSSLACQVGLPHKEQLYGTHNEESFLLRPGAVDFPDISHTS